MIVKKKQPKNLCYQPAVVTFLDILGFRDLVKKAPASRINELLDQVAYFTRPIKIKGVSDNTGFSPTVVDFSDSVVRIWHVNSEANTAHPFGIVYLEILSLLHAQSGLLSSGLLLRGGIAYGEVYATAGRVFGPALIEAHDLESQFAQYPRIVVSPSLLRAVTTNPLLRKHDPEEEKEHLTRLLRQGEDGIWFIDYLRAIWTEFDEEEMYLDFLRNHKAVIERLPEITVGLSSITAKYVWLARYHNAVIDEITDHWFEYFGTDREDLKIAESKVPALYSM